MSKIFPEAMITYIEMTWNLVRTTKNSECISYDCNSLR